MIAIAIVIFFILLFIGAPIAVSMGVAALPWLFCNPASGIVVAQKMFTSIDSFTLMAIPFFMMAGQIMEATGITESIVKFAKSVVGHIRGGMAHTTTLSGMLMAGVSGSSNADASAIGSLMLPALKKSGYKRGFAVSVISSAAGLGPIIPPSIMMIIYSSVTGFPVGKLFMGGIIPGILLGIGYLTVNYIYARKNGMHKEKFAGFGEIWKAFKKAIWALLMPVIILGGIMTGVCTATEAGVLAIVYGLIYGLIRKRINAKVLKKCLVNAVRTTAAPMLLIAISCLFGYMLVWLNVSDSILAFCQNYISGSVSFYLFIIAICFVAGCFIDPNATMLMLTPVIMPIVVALGLDQMQFAMIFIIALLTAGLTPPVGMTLLLVSGIDGTPMEQCIRPALSFLAVMVILLIIMIFVPQISTWIPSFF